MMKNNRNGEYRLDRHSTKDTSPFIVESTPYDYLHQPFNHPDVLIVRSTVPDHVSFRCIKTGSKSLCKELDHNGKKDDLMTLLNLFTGEI